MVIEAIENYNLTDIKPLPLSDKVPSSSFDASFLQGMLKSENIATYFNKEVSQSVSEYHFLSKPADSHFTPVVSAEEKIESNEKNPLETNSSVESFAKSIWPYAQQAARLIDLDPKVLMAQAMLETGWGKFVAKDSQGNSSHNLFNIKAVGDSTYNAVNVKTTEFIGDKPLKITASFKKYDSVEQSFNDYITLIQENPRYKKALLGASNPTLYINELESAGYATDPHYAKKLLSIYQSKALEQALLS